MDEDGIGLVLARASELRAMITSCIHKSSTNYIDRMLTGEEKEKEQRVAFSGSRVEFGETVQAQEAQEEEESLLNIRVALESLEAQLCSLQALQQQQWYEKEAALAEIDNSRKKLLKNLEEYNGEDLEVIKETTAFASEAVEDSNDLLLPPYPTRPSHLLISNNGYPSHSAHKFSQNGLLSGGQTNGTQHNLHGLEGNPGQSESKNSVRGVKAFLGAATKAAITLLGIISVLRLAGFNPGLRRNDSQFKVMGLFQLGGGKEEQKGAAIYCPPGKISVVENGESRCVVKERVEIPFESVVGTADVNYGCG